ncbi:DNA adenine methylase [Tsukamurella pseudospumae]|uniref:DNA adenine methylase n=1 Tax=Tsukamurella pseudospumae TaxID=239498 RepID=UPI00083C9591|nr:DNA adenine methylase [Tsukamurella pseudospumae]
MTTPEPIRVPTPYYGGKAKLATRIAASFPAHRHYVEACAGSLAVLLAKQPSEQETVNDADRRLMVFWKVLRERPAELERACALTPHSRAERELALTIDPDQLDELETARRVFVALTQGRSATLARTGWRNQVAPSHPMPLALAKYAARLGPAAARIAGVSLECRDAVEMVQAYGVEQSTLIYVDPPYEQHSPTGDLMRKWNYGMEMASAAHTELIDAVLAAESMVVVSGYGGGRWDEALARWHRYELETHTAQGGSTAPRGSARTEVLWSNTPLIGLGVSEQRPGDSPGGRTETPPLRCPVCTRLLRQPRTGRRRRWCSDACRVRHYRASRAVADPSVPDGD